MSIFAFVSTKGGVGKTTLALHFAISRARDGERVLLVDADRQGTSSAALALRAARPEIPQVAVLRVADGAALRAVLAREAPNFDVIVIDAGGGDGTALRAALLLADVAIIPFAPRQFDVWGVGDVSGLIRAAQAERKTPLAVLGVLNRADPLSMRLGKANAAARQAVADELTGLGDTLEIAIGNRRAVAIAAAAGLAIRELPSAQRDKKAEAELHAFACKVWSFGV